LQFDNLKQLILNKVMKLKKQTVRVYRRPEVYIFINPLWWIAAIQIG